MILPKYPKMIILTNSIIIDSKISLPLITVKLWAAIQLLPITIRLGFPTIKEACLKLKVTQLAQRIFRTISIPQPQLQILRLLFNRKHNRSYFIIILQATKFYFQTALWSMKKLTNFQLIKTNCVTIKASHQWWLRNRIPLQQLVFHQHRIICKKDLHSK